MDQRVAFRKVVAYLEQRWWVEAEFLSLKEQLLGDSNEMTDGRLFSCKWRMFFAKGSENQGICLEMDGFLKPSFGGFWYGSTSKEGALKDQGAT